MSFCSYLKIDLSLEPLRSRDKKDLDKKVIFCLGGHNW